jgi:hypothetical protein
MLLLLPSRVEASAALLKSASTIPLVAMGRVGPPRDLEEELSLYGP